LKIKFQADADFNQTILNATIRSEPLIDFQTAGIAGIRGLGDDEVLAVAAKSERVLVTHDRRTMPFHFKKFISANESPGVIIVPQLLASNIVVDDLILIWMVTEADEWINRLAYLPI
jgi:hypothetical protein